MGIHIKDSDCTLDERDTCTVCGVYHGNECGCGGRGFHVEGCSYFVKTMEHALADFLEAGQILIESWDDTKVRHYPKYLPSFDEFIADFTSLIEEETV